MSEEDSDYFEPTGVFADPEKTYICSGCGKECKGAFMHAACGGDWEARTSSIG